MCVPQVRGVHQELRSKGAEVEEMVAAAEVKDADNTRLWDQVLIPTLLCCLCRCRPFLNVSVQVYIITRIGHTAAHNNHGKATMQCTMRYRPLQSVTDALSAWGHAICQLGHSTIAVSLA